jgi:hypothetical protein
VRALAKLAEFLQNENGGMSSRRLFGSALVIVSVVAMFMGKPDQIVLSLLGTGTMLIGLTTADARSMQ